MGPCEAVERCTDGRWLPVEETDCDKQVNDRDAGANVDDMMIPELDAQGVET